MMMRLLGIFIAASTVRNVLLRPRPRPPPLPAAGAQPKPDRLEPKQVVARYPCHVWSVDRTRMYLCGVWPIWVFVAIDHYSRKVVAATTPVTNAAGCVATLESAFRERGAPKHIITDQEGVFVSGTFAKFLRRWNVRQRLGAVGKYGSIGVTERAILTLKQEWLRRVAVIRGLDHLSQLLDNFGEYYNGWRGHMTLGGAAPEIVHPKEHWKKPGLPSKRVSGNIECRFFPDTRTTAYRLAA